MDITVEQERTERNDERMIVSGLISEWRAAGLSENEIIEKIKARIFDIRATVWKAKAREQENYAILQNNDEFKKNERSLSTLVFTSVITQRNQAEIVETKTNRIIEDTIAKLRLTGLPEETIAKLIEKLKHKTEKVEKPKIFWCRECGEELPYQAPTRSEPINIPTCKCGKKMEVSQ